jgi:exo-beta-1,3-glucanase (GH17 family)
MSMFESGPFPIALLVALSLVLGQQSARADLPSFAREASSPGNASQTEVSEWPVHAVCYGPHRDGQRPGGPTPTLEQIQEDLRLMRPHWDMIRLYGSSEFGARVLDAIERSGMDMGVLLGIWIAPETRVGGEGTGAKEEGGDSAGGETGGDEVTSGQIDPEAVAANRREVAAGVALAAEYPQLVRAVCVGNETQVSWSPHPLPLELLVRYIRQVRDSVAVPVTAADDYQYWLQSESRALAAEIDFITLHAHPLWNGQSLENGISWLQNQIDAVHSLHPDKLLVVGETGWATSKSREGEQARLMKGAVGESEQAIFYQAVRDWAQEASVSTFLFEAFDENWKGSDNPEDAEKHWGVFGADRKPKQALR